eukprot:m.210235 g.210235  ORF g.210235 m.210235 type:complete len:390 (+) comp19002_c0_seq1:171-1340(+)
MDPRKHLLALPDLVLDLILQNLEVVDIVRFSTLSKRARSVAHYVAVKSSGRPCYRLRVLSHKAIDGLPREQRFVSLKVAAFAVRTWINIPFSLELTGAAGDIGYPERDTQCTVSKELVLEVMTNQHRIFDRGNVRTIVFSGLGEAVHSLSPSDDAQSHQMDISTISKSGAAALARQRVGSVESTSTNASARGKWQPPRVHRCVVQQAPALRDVSALCNVVEVWIVSCESVSNLTPLRNCKVISLYDCDAVRDVSPLAKCSKVYLHDCAGIEDVSALATCTDVVLSDLHLTNMRGLGAVAKLTVQRCTFEDVTPLRSCTDLELRYCDGFDSETLSCLKDVPSLKLGYCGAGCNGVLRSCATQQAWLHVGRPDTAASAPCQRWQSDVNLQI